MYIFFPAGEIFDTDPTNPETINVNTFYDIFDGYYHVKLRFNLTVKKLFGLNPRYLKYLLIIDNNSPPIFIYGKRNYPLPKYLNYVYYAESKIKSTLPTIWDL